jgi:hypothetical protein
VLISTLAFFLSREVLFYMLSFLVLSDFSNQTFT